MEAQLAEYRAKKARERQVSQPDSFLSTFFRGRQPSDSTKKPENDPRYYDSSSVQYKSYDARRYDKPPNPDNAMTSESTTTSFTFTRLWFAKCVLWFVLWMVFLKLEFGAVYFVVSLLFVIYKSTRTGRKTTGAPSAYSVFNPNCERLDGTFTAEQFEKELRFGAGSVH